MNERDMLLNITELAIDRLFSKTPMDLAEYKKERMMEIYPDEFIFLDRVMDLVCSRINECVDICWPLFDVFIPKRDPMGNPTEIEEIRIVSDTQVIVELR